MISSYVSTRGGPGRYFIINGNYLMTLQNSRDCINFTTSRTFRFQTFLLVLKTLSIIQFRNHLDQICMKLKMMAKSLNEIKRDIALVTLDIECLDPASKHSAILHLKETIDLLQLGSVEQSKKIKVDVKEEPNQDDKILNSYNETFDNYPVPAQQTNSFTTSLYRGIIPTCEFCFATFPTVGALDDHMKKCQAVIKQENVTEKRHVDGS